MMDEMMDKKKMKKELLQQLIQLMNEEMSGKMLPEKEMEVSEETPMDEEHSESMEMPESKEPSMVEIEIEKKPLSEGLEEMDEKLESKGKESEMKLPMDEEDSLSHIALKKFQKGLKKKEQE